MGEIYGAVESRTGDTFGLLTTDGQFEEHEATGVVYVRAADLKAAPEMSTAVVEERLRDRPTGWLRVEYRPHRRWDLMAQLQRAEVPTYEADVRPLRRYLSERDDLRFASSSTRDLIFDLEVDPRVPFSEQVAGRARILMVSWRSRAGAGAGSAVLQAWDDEAERDVLRAFLRVAADHHLLTAWNGTPYDFPVIRARAANLGLDVEWWRWTMVDMLSVVRKHFQRGETGEQKASMGLDAVGETILGVPKMDLRAMLRDAGLQPPQFGAPFYYAWEQRPDLLRAYGEHDSLIVDRLEDRKHFLALQKQLAALCRTVPDDRSLYATQLADGVFVRVGGKRGVHFANKPKPEDDDFDQAQGATVLRVAPGAHERVYMLDFAGMYPSILLSLNISPETLVAQDATTPKVCAPNGAHFRTDRIGVFPQVIEQFVARRGEAKAAAKAAQDAQQQLDLTVQSDGYKVFCNSMYGLLLSPWSRYYLVDAGEAVTATGRLLFGLMADAIRRTGGRVIFGDTDGGGGSGGDAAAATDAANDAVAA